jgi:DHA1 family multidrug resistance protein-like MFS transporter
MIGSDHIRWRWALWEIIWMSGPVLIIMLLFLPETSTDTILLRRAQRLRRITQNSNIHAPSEIDQGDQTIGRRMSSSLVKPLEIMAKDPAIFFTNLYTSLVYGIYYSFFEAFPLVYPVMYGFSSGQSGLIFVSLAAACGIGMVVYIIYIYSYLLPDFRKHGHREHEHRLVPALIASIFPPVGLALFGKNSAIAEIMKRLVFGNARLISTIFSMDF